RSCLLPDSFWPVMNSQSDLHARLRRFFSDLQSRTPGLASFALQLPEQQPILLGNGSAPAFTITCHNRDAVTAILSNDETRIALAYVNGAIDFDGDMLELFKLRGAVSDHHPLLRLWFVHVHPRLFGQTKSDEKWI